MSDDNVIPIGWGASSEAIRAACSIAGYEPPAMRWRRKPSPPIDYPAVYAAETPSAIRGRKTGNAQAGATVTNIREARERMRVSDATIACSRPREPSTNDGISAIESIGTRPALDERTRPKARKSEAETLERRSLAIGVYAISADVSMTSKAR